MLVAVTARTIAVAALSLLALGGCPGGGDPPDAGSECGRGPGVVELGQGGSRLRDLPATGAELQIVRGSQGGIHVLVGFRVRDMELEMIAVYRLVDPDRGETVGLETVRELRSALFTTDGTDTIRNPDLVVLDDGSDDFTRFVGRPLRLELEARSVGSHACDAREVTLLAPI
jgi:hypothetical protein